MNKTQQAVVPVALWNQLREAGYAIRQEASAFHWVHTDADGRRRESSRTFPGIMQCAEDARQDLESNLWAQLTLFEGVPRRYIDEAQARV